MLGIVFALVLAAGPAEAGPILVGSVSYNVGTGLYTYAYALNTDVSPARIDEINILVAPNLPSPPDDYFDTLPNSFTSPDDDIWTFDLAFPGDIANPPVSEQGGFWRWHTSGLSTGVNPNQGYVSGWTLITPVAPTGGSTNNYFLYGLDYHLGPSGVGGDGVVEWGHIVAPCFGDDCNNTSFNPTEVPEPTTALLFGSGLCLLRYARRRRQPRA